MAAAFEKVVAEVLSTFREGAELEKLKLLAQFCEDALGNAELVEVVCRVLYQRLALVGAPFKVALLYALDYISKNGVLGGEFQVGFTPNLVPNFTAAFLAVSAADKGRLKRMLQTWSDVGLYPAALREIQARLAELDTSEDALSQLLHQGPGKRPRVGGGVGGEQLAPPPLPHLHHLPYGGAVPLHAAAAMPPGSFPLAPMHHLQQPYFVGPALGGGAALGGMPPYGVPHYGAAAQQPYHHLLPHHHGMPHQAPTPAMLDMPPMGSAGGGGGGGGGGGLLRALVAKAGGASAAAAAAAAGGGGEFGGGGVELFSAASLALPPSAAYRALYLAQPYICGSSGLRWETAEKLDAHRRSSAAAAAAEAAARAVSTAGLWYCSSEAWTTAGPRSFGAGEGAGGKTHFALEAARKREEAGGGGGEGAGGGGGAGRKRGAEELAPCVPVSEVGGGGAGGAEQPPLCPVCKEGFTKEWRDSLECNVYVDAVKALGGKGLLHVACR
jgi:hypothetical protein